MQHGYAALALIPPTAPAVMPEGLRDLLQHKLNAVAVEISVSGNRVDLVVNGLRFSLHVEYGEHVLAESQEIATLYGKVRGDSAVIATCNRRIMLTSDDDSPLYHFNDYIFVLEALEQIDGVILFDPRAESFI